MPSVTLEHDARTAPTIRPAVEPPAAAVFEPPAVGAATVHYYTHDSGGSVYGLSRTAAFHMGIMGLPHAVHHVPRLWAPEKRLGNLHILLERRWGDLLGRTASPSHALSHSDAMAGNDVVTVHDLIPWRHAREYATWGCDPHWMKYDRALTERALRKARRVVAISRQAAHELSESGLRAHTVVGNRLDPSLVDAARRMPRAHRRRGLLVVGENEPRKRMELAIQAAGILGEPLTWIGHRNTEPWRLDYERRVADAARRHHVQLVRRPGATQQGLCEAYATHRLLVAPSLWEGFNLPVAEALLFGCPVVGINEEPNSYWERIFTPEVPLFRSVGELRDYSDYDADGTFEELDARLGLTDYAGYRRGYRDVYREVGVPCE